MNGSPLALLGLGPGMSESKSTAVPCVRSHARSALLVAMAVIVFSTIMPSHIGRW